MKYIFNMKLKKFNEYKDNFVFNQLELTIDSKNQVMYKDVIIKDCDENIINESEYFINAGYKLKGPQSKLISNIFPYEFKFRGKKVNNIECIFQALKFKDIKMQNLVLKYSVLDSNNIKFASDYDWKETGILYWQGKPINRFSKEYELFTNEIYFSAIQNPLYRSVLKKCDKYILHSIGETDPKKTVFTRYEFEKMLNCLSEFVKKEY